MSSYVQPTDAGRSKAAGQSRPIRVVLADDHRPMRSSLRRLLEREADLDVIAEAGDVPAAVRDVRRYHPEVLVLGLRTPEGSSIDALRQLRSAARRPAIVVITMDDNQMLAELALEAGALGCVLKDTADTELPQAIRCVRQGHRYVSPGVGLPPKAS